MVYPANVKTAIEALILLSVETVKQDYPEVTVENIAKDSVYKEFFKRILLYTQEDLQNINSFPENGAQRMPADAVQRYSTAIKYLLMRLKIMA